MKVGINIKMMVVYDSKREERREKEEERREKRIIEIIEKR